MELYENHTEHFNSVDRQIDTTNYHSAFQQDLIELLSVIAGSLAEIADILEGNKNDNG